MLGGPRVGGRESRTGGAASSFCGTARATKTACGTRSIGVSLAVRAWAVAMPRQIGQGFDVLPWPLPGSPCAGAVIAGPAAGVAQDGGVEAGQQRQLIGDRFEADNVVARNGPGMQQDRRNR